MKVVGYLVKPCKIKYIFSIMDEMKNETNERIVVFKLPTNYVENNPAKLESIEKVYVG